MTKEEIISKARDELDDNGVDYYSTMDLVDAYEDGYEEVALYTGVIERMASVSLLNDTVYYNLYEAILDYYSTFAIWNPDINDWLSNKDIKYFQSKDLTWEKRQGSTREFAVVNFQLIALHPHKVIANNTDLEEFYHAVPFKNLDMGSVPEMPEQFQVVLQYYIMQDLFAQAEEFTKSEIYNAKYLDKRKALQVYTANRSFPDRVNVLRGQFTGGSRYGR